MIAPSCTLGVISGLTHLCLLHRRHYRRERRLGRGRGGGSSSRLRLHREGVQAGHLQTSMPASATSPGEDIHHQPLMPPPPPPPHLGGDLGDELPLVLLLGRQVARRLPTHPWPHSLSSSHCSNCYTTWTYTTLLLSHCFDTPFGRDVTPTAHMPITLLPLLYKAEVKLLLPLSVKNKAGRHALHLRSMQLGEA